MFVVVPLAFHRARLADASTQLEHLTEHLLVRSGPPEPQVAGRVAHIRAVKADSDALAHVHPFRAAGVRAAPAHFRAIHHVMDRIPERLVDVSLHVGVQADHLADGHGLSPPSPHRASEESSQGFRPGMRTKGQARVHSWPVALTRVANQMSGAGDGLPGLAEEKVSVVPSQLMNGRASNPGELSPSRWIAGPNGSEVFDLVE